MDDARFQVLYDFQVRDERLERSAKLLDSINQNVERMGTSLLRLERGSGSAFGRIGEHADRSKRSMLDLASAVYVVRGAFDIARSTIGTAVNALGQFGDTSIKAFGERTSTIRGYTTFLNGDRGQAELEFYRAQQFAQKTDFTSQTIEQGQSRLLAQGFRGHDLYATLFAASDLAAASPDDKNETLKHLVKGFTDVKAKGHLQGEELTTQFAEAGLNLVLVKEELRKSLGLKNIGAVDKKISAGKVSADVALPAIQRAILAQLHTTKAGEFATSSAGSLTSLISNRDEAFANLAKSFDADQALPAMERYKKALTDQTAGLDINNQRGRNAALVLQDLANASISAKAGLSELETAFTDSFTASYASQLRRDGRDFNAESTTTALHNLGDAIGKLGGVAAIAIGSTNGLVANLAQRVANVITHDTGILSALSNGDYGTAAKLAAENLYNRTPAGAIAQRTGIIGGAKDIRDDIRDRLYGQLLGGDSDDDLTAQTSADAQRRAVARLSGGNPTIPRLVAEDRRKSSQTADAKASQTADAKAKREAGYNVPIWHYEPGAGGSSTLSASALNAVVASQVSGGGSDRQRPINVEKIEIVVNGATQSPQDIAHAVHEELVTKLRSLPRAPSLRQR